MRRIDRDYRIVMKLNIEWIETLIEVADNDPDAEMSWFIPALTLDYRGYMMEPFWENVGSLNSNEEKTAYFSRYARGIIRQIQKEIERGD